jgi:hypothetical protein
MQLKSARLEVEDDQSSRHRTTGHRQEAAASFSSLKLWQAKTPNEILSKLHSIAFGSDPAAVESLPCLLLLLSNLRR